MKITKRISLYNVAAPIVVLALIFVTVGFYSKHLFAAPVPNTTDLELLSESWSFDAEWSYFDVKDGIVYKADYMSDTLRAIDARDPQNIQTLSVAKGQIAYPDKVFIIGNYAYVHGLESRSLNKIKIAIFDISDPYNITQVGAFSDPSITPCTSYGTGMETVGSSIVLDLACNNQLAVLDLTDPTAPTVGGFFDYSSYRGAASYKTNTTDTGVGLSFYQSASLPTYSYIEVDVTDTSNPVLHTAVPSASLTLVPYGSTGGRQLQAVRQGDYIYLSQEVQNSNTDFYVVDVTNPASPVQVYSDTALPPCYFDLLRSVNSTSLLMMCGADIGPSSIASSIIDISNPLAPSFGPSFGVMGYDDISEISDEKLYISGGYNNMQLAVYDLNNATNKGVLLGAEWLNLGEFYSMNVIVPTDTTALLMSQEEMVIQTVDITDPSSVAITGTQFLVEADGSTPVNYAYPKIPIMSDSGNSLYLLEHGITSSTRQHNGFLTILDISDLNNIELAARVPSPNNEMLINGKIVGNTWYTLSISRATSQTILRTYTIDETAKTITELDSQTLLSTKGTLTSPQKRDIEIIGDYAIISAHQQQVEIVNVSDLSNLGAPVLSNLPVLNNYSLGNPFAYGGQLLVPVAGYLYSIDASDPMAMTINSTITNPLFTLTSNYASAAEGDQFQSNALNTFIYTNQNGDSHARLDMTDPRNPVLLDSVNSTGLFPDFLDGWENVEPHAIVFRDSYAYAVTAQGDSNFYTFDASDFTQPRPLDSIVNLVPAVEPNALAFYNNHAYLGSYDSWEVDAEIAAYDISDPTSPVVVGGPIHEYKNTYDMATQGQYLYVSQSWGSMTAYDLSNPTFPRAVGRHEGALYVAPDIDVVGQYAYAADTRNGLVIYDIADPTNPTHMSTFEDVNFTGLTALEVNGDYVYGVTETENAVIVIDVSNRAAPTTVTTIQLDEFDELDSAVLKDDYLYVTGLGSTEGAHVSIFDTVDPAAPAHIGSYIGDVTSSFEDIVVEGDTAFIAAAGNSSIDLIDVSDKTSPQLIRRITSETPSLSYVQKLAIYDGNLYSAARDGQSMNAYAITSLDSPPAVEEPEEPLAPPVESTAEPASPTSDILADTGINPKAWLMLALIAITIGVGSLTRYRFAQKLRL